MCALFVTQRFLEILKFQGFWFPKLGIWLELSVWCVGLCGVDWVKAGSIWNGQKAGQLPSPGHIGRHPVSVSRLL